ncbi:MAG: 50S ribosomal protein L3 [Leptolyngbya sp. PLA3]|nr:MAG: 50S ribosomal protein L3 [Cyanobacteria bacterium CYA]MCE7969084.1 50S ribosomal protein L3 [Leptolyngbya sp. PL-A3]
MSLMLIGTKLGMTRVFADGKIVPVTVIELGPCVVTQLRTEERDGYTAVQVGFGDMKPRNSTIPMIGHDAKAGSTALRHHREFRCDADEVGKFELGQVLKVDRFEGTKYVDVVGTSKGKGTAGVMKRHGFKGMTASHGVERKHRSPGSIGAHATNRGHSGKLKKGKRMVGHLGADRVTARNLDVVRIDVERNLILVKGPVPGANKSMVMVRTPVRLNRHKSRIVKDS